MPLLASPNRGYADWQRIENWDSQLLYDQQGSGITVGVGTPILDCSRWAYTAGFIFCGSGQIEVDFSWFADAQGTTTLGSRSMYIDQFQPNGGQLHIPNLGPYVQVGLLPISVAGMNYHLQVFQTNRIHPLDLIPSKPYLIDMQTGSLAAGAQQYLYPTDLYAGPLSVWFDLAGGNGALELMGLNANGTYDYLAGWNITQMQTDVVMMAPAGSWRVRVLNNAASTEAFILAAVQSSTGAT